MQTITTTKIVSLCYQTNMRFAIEASLKRIMNEISTNGDVNLKLHKILYQFMMEHNRCLHVSSRLRNSRTYAV